MKGTMSAQKSHQGSETQTGELLQELKIIVFPRRGVQNPIFYLYLSALRPLCLDFTKFFIWLLVIKIVLLRQTFNRSIIDDRDIAKGYSLFNFQSSNFKITQCQMLPQSSIFVCVRNKLPKIHYSFLYWNCFFLDQKNLPTKCKFFRQKCWLKLQNLQKPNVIITY